MLKKHTEKKMDRYSLGSRKKLGASVKHKITRTFVGALDAVESEISKLNIPESMSIGFKNAVRRKILGMGNDQIRNIEVELEQYNIEFIPYHLEMKVIPLKEEGNDEEG